MPRLLPGTSPETDLYALTDDGLSLGRPAVEVAKALLDSGIKILQYREKEKKAGQMLKECMELRRLTREAGACFIVNDHVDIAILCEADGVHVGQEDLPVEAVRRKRVSIQRKLNGHLICSLRSVTPSYLLHCYQLPLNRT